MMKHSKYRPEMCSTITMLCAQICKVAFCLVTWLASTSMQYIAAAWNAALC